MDVYTGGSGDEGRDWDNLHCLWCCRGGCFWKKVGRKGRLNNREGSGSLALTGVPFRRERVNLNHTGKARLRMKFSRSTGISLQVSLKSNTWLNNSTSLSDQKAEAMPRRSTGHHLHLPFHVLIPRSQIVVPWILLPWGNAKVLLLHQRETS